MPLSAALEEVGAGMDRAFDALLPIPEDARARLYEAMRYAAIGGGKRIRPLLVIAPGLVAISAALAFMLAASGLRGGRDGAH